MEHLNLTPVIVPPAIIAESSQSRQEESMPGYRASGVFVEEVSFRYRSIEGVDTSVAGLMNPTRTGPLRGRPEVLTSFAAFKRFYGDPRSLNLGVQTVLNHTALAAKAFFDNGARRLFVARTAAGVNANGRDGVSSSATAARALESKGRVTFLKHRDAGL